MLIDRVQEQILTLPRKVNSEDLQLKKTRCSICLTLIPVVYVSQDW
jgi:hypothetical protein